MIRIFTDTSTLYTPSEGKEMGVEIFPLVVTINGKSYREYNEISSEEFTNIINEGHVPVSSQPPVGMVIEAYEKYKDDEIINITMADGLSGTYQSAVGAKKGLENEANIHVVNSQTLCGPHRYMLQVALELVKQGKTSKEIIDTLKYLITTECSYLIPQDFDYLKRGGRLTPLAAGMSKLLKIRPVVMTTEDGKRLEKFVVGRTFFKSVDAVINEMKKHILDNDYIVYVSHAGVLAQATKTKEKIKNVFPDVKVKIKDLSPCFITQGGPSCLAIQWIKKII